jgi:hypothetical protein
MDGLSFAASIVGVIQLTGNIVKICEAYIQGVKNARDDIIALNWTALSLKWILHNLQDSLQGRKGMKLPISSHLASGIADCLADLRELEAKINTSRGNKMMRRLGLRSLSWPMKRAEMGRVLENLERYKSSFTLALQIDQTYASPTVCPE